MGTTQTVLNPSLCSPEVEDFERALGERVIGQDRAVRRLARVYQMHLAGLSAPGRPISNLFSRSHGLRQNAPWKPRPKCCLAIRTR